MGIMLRETSYTTHMRAIARRHGAMALGAVLSVLSFSSLFTRSSIYRPLCPRKTARGSVHSLQSRPSLGLFHGDFLLARVAAV